MTADSRRRVVITGLGMVTPLGTGVASNLHALSEGRPGIRRIRSFDASAFPTKVAGEVPDLDAESFNPRGPGPAEFAQSKKTAYAIAAAEAAVAHAGLGPRHLESPRAGLYLGVGLTFPERLEDTLLDSDEAALLAYRRKQLAGADPHAILTRLAPVAWPVDSPERVLARRHGLEGPVAAFTSACAASAHAIGAAFHQIRDGRADVFLAGGCDAMITPLGLAGFCLLDVTTRRHEEPSRACRPFDRTRDGTVIAEGAVLMVLEEYASAVRRGAEPLAEILGFGATCDAYRLTDTPPGGDGLARAMVAALHDGSVAPEEVDYINAHGTATPQNDVSETRAIKTVLGERARRVPISSTKAMTGHLVAAAGAIEAAICVLALRHGIIFPTVNLVEADPECDLDYVAGGSREGRIRTVLSNSSGLGGQNGALAFRRIG